MPNVYYKDSALAATASELLVPNKKPIGQVSLKNPGKFHGYWLCKPDLKDLVGKYHGVYSGTTNYLYREYGGVVSVGAGSAGRVNCGKLQIGGITQFTLTICAKHDGTGTAEHSLASCWPNAGGSAGILWRSDPSASNQLEGFIQDSTDSTVGGNFTDLDMTTAVYGTATLRFNADDGSGLSAYLDGVKSATTFATSNALHASNPAEDFYLGDTPHTTGDHIRYGGIIVAMLHQKALTDEEIFDLHRDLYQDLIASQPYIVIGVPAGPAGGIQPYTANYMRMSH